MNLLRRTFGFSTEENVVVPKSEPKSEVDVPKAPEGVPEAGSVGATLWSLLAEKLGGDVLTSGISLPSWLYEPLSILQRQAEMIEYGDVLTGAASSPDPVERLAFVAGFAVSGYSATQRYKPDFNPLLGETFEYIDNRNNTKFFAEQVSHHPPISAIHAINGDNWAFWQNSSPTTKFLGNSIDLDTQGRTNILFPKTGDHYFYTNPQCTRIHNIIFGSMWIEHFGSLAIKNVDGSMTCTVIFKKSGLFQGTQFKVEGHIEDKFGKKLVKLEGRWDEYLEGTWLIDTSNVKKGTVRRLWQVSQNETEKDEYNFTAFSRSLNDFNHELESILLPTDSRRRLDRHFLEKGDPDTSTYWKKIMEERQRADKRVRKETWQPVWFKKEETDGQALWVYRGDYWEQRDSKFNAFHKGEDHSKFLLPAQVKGLACDFSSYAPELSLAEGDNTDTPTTDTFTEDQKEDPTDGDHSDDFEQPEEWSPREVENQIPIQSMTLGSGELVK